MLTKSERSYMMLVKVRYKHHIKIIVPIFLGAIDELIIAFGDLIRIINRLFPLWDQKTVTWISRQMAQYVPTQNFSLELILNMLHKMLDEVRKHKGWKLVEVDAKEIYLKVELL